MTQHTPVVADEGSDVLAQECAAVAAYLIHGEGQALGRCVLTAVIMHHVMQAARENRTGSLPEVRRALSEASRKIRPHSKSFTHQGDGNMRLTPHSEADAKRLTKRELLLAGWHDARITECNREAQQAQQRHDRSHGHCAGGGWQRANPA